MIEIKRADSREDRLISIHGTRTEALIAEFSLDNDTRWHPATIYVGTSTEQWRRCNVEMWNRGADGGVVPEGNVPCLWNYFRDLDTGLTGVRLRFRVAAATGTGAGVSTDAVEEFPVDFGSNKGGFVIDYRNVAALAGGTLPDSWDVAGDSRGTKVIRGHLDARLLESPYPVTYVETAPSTLLLNPRLSGRQKIYIGIGESSSTRISFSGKGPFIPVPGEDADRHRREYFLGDIDMTDRRLRISPGGARLASDTLLRYIRFVPVAGGESQSQRMQKEAKKRGRSFAGYLEQVTTAYYEGETMSLREHARNAMQLHRDRGCTDVYIHAIRVGFSAWYHSNVVDRYLPSGAAFKEHDPGQMKWTEWMKQGDPLQVAVDEAHAAGLLAFADSGMNITYLGTDIFHYRSMTGAFAEDHPEYMCKDAASFFDYRHPEVRAYAASIIGELMEKYDLDGINLDFARFAYNKAFDIDSLMDVMEQIQQKRKQTEKKWGHPIILAVRIPSYLYHTTMETYTGDYPEFLEALKRWTANGWIERAMVCCMEPAQLKNLSVKRYVEALAGTSVELWGDLYVETPESTPEDFLNVARRWSNEGLDGGFFLYDVGWSLDFAQINWKLRLVDSHEDKKPQ